MILRHGKPITDEDYVRRALEITVHVALLILFTTTCLLILRPFIPLIAWGIIIAIAAYPGYVKLQHVIGGRSVLAAVICSTCLLAILIVPVGLLTGSLIGGTETLATHLKQGAPIIPPPPARMKTWPIVGAPLANAWQLASENLAAALRTFAPQIKAVMSDLLRASAGIGLAVLQWILSILVAGFLLAKTNSAAALGHSVTTRFFGEKGTEIEELAGATIRSVTTGILGVAVIQSFLAALGFFVARLPGAGLWGVMFLLAAVLQLGIVVLIPAVIYMFAIATTTKAVLFLGWCLIVALIDNVLKPLLLGRGVPVPMAVVFLGAIGGFMMMGIVGLFVGAIALCVGYTLFIAWLEGAVARAPDTHTETGLSSHTTAAD